MVPKRWPDKHFPEFLLFGGGGEGEGRGRGGGGGGGGELAFIVDEDIC